MFQKIKQYVDFKLQITDLTALFALLFCFIIIKIFNITEIYENSLLENLQLIPLLLGAIFCFRAKNHKSFFAIIGLLLILFFLRELSYGRVIYGVIPGNPHDFYPLSHFKYGFITNILIAVYLVAIGIFAIIKKVWVDIVALIKKVKFPIWTFLFTFIFILAEIFGEKLDNTVIEEIAELTIYCFTMSICLIYIRRA